jgi:hypothetical protein
VAILALALSLAISTSYYIYCLRKERKKYKQLLLEGKNNYDTLLKQYETKLKSIMEEDKQRQLREAMDRWYKE